MEPHEIGEIFDEWNGGMLDSFLVEITAESKTKIFNRKAFVDVVLDAAGQGTENGLR